MKATLAARRLSLILVVPVLLAVNFLTACQSVTATMDPATTPTEQPVLEPSAVPVKLRVGVLPVPHGDIVNFIKDTLAPAVNLDIEVIEFSDYILPNIALNDGIIDVNYFQHAPYLIDYNASHGTDLVSVAGVHVEPMGIYSKTLTSLADLTDGAVVAIPNDVSNRGRALNLLAANSLLILEDGIGQTATLADITGNPKHLNFQEFETDQLVQSLEEAAISVITGNYALKDGLIPAKDALALESSKDNPYVNIVAVKHGNEANPAVQAFVALITSDEVKQFINQTYDGSVIPAFSSPTFFPK